MMAETEAQVWRFNVVTSCTVVIGEAVLFIGGGLEERQISQISPLGLIRIGTLPFPLYKGTCLVMGSQLFLGFSNEDENGYWSR